MKDFTKPVAIIGYSGHAFVVIDALKLMGHSVTAYCDSEEKGLNPFGLVYLGREKDAIEELKGYDYFASVGDNRIRQKIIDIVESGTGRAPATVIHPSAIIAATATVNAGVLVSAGAIINSLAIIGKGSICNTGAIIEHESSVGQYVHIAPGAVLCGNVIVGDHSFIGANSVIRQGVVIGQNATIGAGSVVTRDVPDGTQVIGNPAR